MKRVPSCPQKSRRSGFTLTEVLLVLAILGVIAAMVIPNLLATQADALKKQSKNNIMALEQIVNQYAIAHDGDWPQSIEVLLSPGQDKDGKPVAPFIQKIPKDGWGTPLNYSVSSKGGTGDKPSIWSNGKDKINNEGSGDDINNWSDI